MRDRFPRYFGITSAACSLFGPKPGRSQQSRPLRPYRAGNTASVTRIPVMPRGLPHPLPKKSASGPQGRSAETTKGGMGGRPLART